MPIEATKAACPVVHTEVSIAGRRGHNEDTPLFLESEVCGMPVCLLAVADGMGGHAYGEVASRLACQAFRDAWPAFLETLDAALASSYETAEEPARSFFEDCFNEADRLIAAHVEEEDVAEGMGTTLVAALALGQQFIFANVGDSRGYLIRRDDVEQITKDHSVVADAMRRGFMQEDEADTSVFKHALTRSLDGTGDASPDLFPASGWLSGESGAVVLLCSDGLYGPLTDLEIFEHITRTLDLRTGCHALVWKALQEGSQDNVSVVAIEAGTLPRAADLMSIDPKDLKALSGWMTDNPREKAETAWRLRVGALTLGIVGLCLAMLFTWKLNTREMTPVAEPPVATVTSIELLGSGSVNPSALAWMITGENESQYQFAISITGPADSATGEKPSIQLIREGRSVDFAEIEDTWPGEFKPGEYEWSVVAHREADTIASSTGNFSIRAAPANEEQSLPTSEPEDTDSQTTTQDLPDNTPPRPTEADTTTQSADEPAVEAEQADTSIVAPPAGAADSISVPIQVEADSSG